MSGATGVVDANSALVRKKWLLDGILQRASTSFWAPYTGNSSDSIVHQENNEKATDGHNITFDYDGNIAGKAVKDKNTAYGKGEQKKKFSETLTVSRYRLVVDNGDKFDAVNIGDLSISEHSDSRSKLADLFIRWKDQALFDTAQSFYLNSGSVAPKHGIYLDASSTNLSYQNLVSIEKTLRTGSGYVSGTNPLGYSIRTTPETSPVISTTTRAPLQPFRLSNGKSIWLMVLDPYTVANLKSASGATTGLTAMALQADLRGNKNMMFTGIIGQIGRLLIVEAEAFFGDNSGGANLEDTSVESAGLRAWDGSNNKWTGETGYVTPDHSRNLILGANAMQIGFGKQPDYKFQKSQDFGIKSESAMEFWMDSQKVFLDAENTDDYVMAKRAAMDNAVIPFDVKF